MEKFNYNPDKTNSFDLWFRRLSDLITDQQLDRVKTKVLVSLLDNDAYTTYNTHISPRTPSDLDWQETVSVMKKIFSPQKSLLRKRFECFRQIFNPGEDLNAFDNTLNANCEEAEVNNITDDTFKCLALVFSFQAPELADYRMRFLRRMDENESVTFKELVQDYHALKTIKEDAKLLEHPTDIHHNVRAMSQDIDTDIPSAPALKRFKHLSAIVTATSTSQTLCTSTRSQLDHYLMDVKKTSPSQCTNILDQ